MHTVERCCGGRVRGQSYTVYTIGYITGQLACSAVGRMHSQAGKTLLRQPVCGEWTIDAAADDWQTFRPFIKDQQRPLSLAVLWRGAWVIIGYRKRNFATLLEYGIYDSTDKKLSCRWTNGAMQWRGGPHKIRPSPYVLSCQIWSF